MKCPNCSKEIADNAVFCGFCGTSLADRVHIPEVCICPQCQTENKPGSKFCVRCGTRLDVAIPEEASNTKDAAIPVYDTKPEVAEQPVSPVYQETAMKPESPVYQETAMKPGSPVYQGAISPGATVNPVGMINPEVNTAKSGKVKKAKKSTNPQEAVAGKQKKKKGKIIAFFIFLLLFIGLGGTAGFIVAKQGINLEELLLGKSEIAWLQYNPQQGDDTNTPEVNDEDSVDSEEKLSEEDSDKKSEADNTQTTDTDGTVSGDSDSSMNEETLPGDGAGTDATGLPTQTPGQSDSSGSTGEDSDASQQTGETAINLVGSWNAQEFYDGVLDDTYTFNFNLDNFEISSGGTVETSYKYRFNADTMVMTMTDAEGNEAFNYYLQVTDENTFRMYRLFNIEEDEARTQDYRFTPDGKAYKPNDYFDLTRTN